MLHQFQFDPRTVFPELDHHERISPSAVRLYDHARQLANRRRRWAWLRRRSYELQTLADVARQMITGQHAGGTRSVPLNQIRGSVGRRGDFDAEFFPLKGITENRWVRIATAVLRGESLPPVELVQVGDTYYVVDGHHRVSVCRMLHHTHVDALVTVWDMA